MHEITVGSFTVQIVRKAIKNLHLGVYPPDGHVRVATPLALNDEAVRLAVIGKLAWIKRQKAQFEAQPRQSEREMVSGESHYFLGRRYRLRVVYGDGPARVVVRSRSLLEMQVPRGASVEDRAKVLRRWYREELKELVPPLVEKWQGILGVTATGGWGIKRMKTKWGTCNTDARRIWLNLELAKKPSRCLDYVVAHELVHLLQRHHNDHFVALMNQHLPQWRAYRQELNSSPLAAETWAA
jgi:hypothetical protein